MPGTRPSEDAHRETTAVLVLLDPGACSSSHSSSAARCLPASSPLCSAATSPCNEQDVVCVHATFHQEQD